MRAAVVASLIGISLFGCPEKPSTLPAPVDSGAVAEVVDAGPIDAGPSVLEPTVIAAFADGGSVTVAAQAEIDPATSLTVTLPAGLKDFRLRLLDHREQVVPSDDELSGTTYRLVPTAPLATGRRYSLMMDAELGPVITDATGGTWSDWQLDFRIAGEVVPEKPSAPAQKKKKRK